MFWPGQRGLRPLLTRACNPTAQGRAWRRVSLVVVAAGPLCVPLSLLPAMRRLHLRSVRLGPSPHDSDSAAGGSCLSVRLRSRINFHPPPRKAARSLPGRASATHLVVQRNPALLRVACLSQCHSVLSMPTALQSVETASSSLLTARRRLRPADQNAGQQLLIQTSKDLRLRKERHRRSLSVRRKGKDDVWSRMSRLSRKWLAGLRPAPITSPPFLLRRHPLHR